jgi:secreted trypsin-like serine protease
MSNKLKIAGILCAIAPVLSCAGALPENASGAREKPREYREVLEASKTGKWLQPKIIGGRPAGLGQFPWQVSLQVTDQSNPLRAHFCGGSIYNEKWIVTAAHCTYGLIPKEVAIVAGTIKLDSTSPRVAVDAIFVHHLYNRDRNHPDNDIALLRLQTPLTFGAQVRKIALISPAEETSKLNAGTLLDVTGWGSTAEGGNVVRDLQYVTVPYVERARCNRPLAYDGQITDNMICAGVEVGGKDSCQGDSGGPLATRDTGVERLAGVVSWGEGCARPDKVGVYARVAKFKDWVERCVAAPAQCRVLAN